jgi:hypothetical protein
MVRRLAAAGERRLRDLAPTGHCLGAKGARLQALGGGTSKWTLQRVPRAQSCSANTRNLAERPCKQTLLFFVRVQNGSRGARLQALGGGLRSGRFNVYPVPSLARETSTTFCEAAAKHPICGSSMTKLPIATTRSGAAVPSPIAEPCGAIAVRPRTASQFVRATITLPWGMGGTGDSGAEGEPLGQAAGPP